ncbi:MAG: ATP-binding protein [Candidatus Aramenus sulfurataquae]|jgi:energy-coupling factor transporter ATP-binding protein EcfA2|uniref:ATP-binding protein n=2 Tax=Candidatus Aramenus sulfurataquae TaxID=1326980 RepID=A0A0F2LQY7_9CREN|nr:ATP-binding protein [Candidatus Aramenus sulfurataquae]
MQEVRHAIVVSVIVAEVLGLHYFFASSGFVTVVEREVTVTVLLFLDSIMTFIIFTSIIIDVAYYFSLAVAFSYIGIDVFSITYLSSFIAGISISSFIYFIVNRSFSDTLVTNARNFRPKFHLTTIAVSVGFWLAQFLLFRSPFLSLGSLVDVVLISLVGEIQLSPLSAASWLSLPYVLSQLGVVREDKGVCIGEILGVLRRTSFSRSRLNVKYSWQKVKAKYCLSFENAKNYNVVILGTSGSGKSHLAKKIIEKLDVSYLVFDVHGEYKFEKAKRLDASTISVNPLSLFGQSPRQRALEVAYMLKSVFNLGNLQTIDLYNLIFESYQEKGIYEDDQRSWSIQPPTFRDVVVLAERKKKFITSSAELNKITALEPYLNFVANNMFFSNSVNFEEIFGESYVIDFSSITIPEVKYIMVETFLRALLSYIYLGKTSNLKKVVILDEAPFVLSKESGEQLVERLFAEGRKFGLGFVVISQTTEYVKKLISNSAYVFVLNMVEPGDVEYVSRLIAGADQDVYKAIYENLRKLERGMIITRNILHDEIFLVHVSE